MAVSKEQIEKEVQYITSRSGGPGGQSVNKVETRVQVIFNIENSKALSDRQKEKIYLKTKNKLTQEGNIVVSSDETRSQLRNKNLALKKLEKLLNDSLKTVPKRLKTKPTKASQKKRLESKKKQSEKKDLRKRID